MISTEGLSDGDVLVALDREAGNELEHRLHVQGLAVFHGEFGDLRLADGPHAKLCHGLVEPLGQQAVDHIFANLGRQSGA